MTAGSGLVGAFLFGFALGAAPGPVQLLILSQTARRGLGGGLRVMLGANLTLFGILLVLALGLAAAEPSETVLRVLKVIGGAFLIGLAVLELRSLVREARPREAPVPASRWGPTAVGILAVLVNPGAWLFFATTASAVLATAAADGGRPAAVATAVALTIGVSCSDFLFSMVGSGGRRLLGDGGIRRVRIGLTLALVVVGAVFVVQGLLG